MKVAFISNSIQDGAGIAAFRILKSVANKGAECVFFSNDDSKKPEQKKLKIKRESGIVKYFKDKFYFKKYRLPALMVKPEYDYFTVLKLDHSTSFKDLGYVPDIIHLHWINNILDYPSFFKTLPPGIPIVWTLHDMSAFTGGCIYSWDCRKFETSCEHCPQLPRPSGKFDLSLYSQQLKYDLFKDKNIHLVADSYWIEEEARKSLVFKDSRSLNTIHYSIDTDIFKPIDKVLCKETFGLDKDTILICFGATYLNSKRKGMKELLKALEIVYSTYKNISCLVYGSNFSSPEGYNLPPMLSLGKIESDHLLKTIHSSADMFIIPSLQEAFGQTCLEAMSCGTPVVGFRVGGIPDMIIPEETGLLADPGNIMDLAAKITWMIVNPEKRKAMGLKARSFAVSNFSMDKQGDKYMDIYRQVTDSNAHA